MTTGVVDSTVVIHLFHRNANAKAWLVAQTAQLSVTPITWLEIMRGAPGKSGQAICEALLDQFEMVHLTRSDQDWAMEQMLKYRLSHGVEMNDCLIASVSYRLQVPIYTHNVRHMVNLLPTALVIQPYVL